MAGCEQLLLLTCSCMITLLPVKASISLGSCQLSCSQNEDQVPRLPVPQGPPGKRGPKGMIGSIGPVGPPGLPGVCRNCGKLEEDCRELRDELDRLRDVMFPRDCIDANMLTNGVHVIYHGGMYTQGIQVYCDQHTDDGGWTVIQRREDGSEDFFRGWDDYVQGFGLKEKEFWLGLEVIHQITKNQTHELRFDFVTKSDEKIYAKYRIFQVAGADDNYRITVSGYSGNAGDSMAYHDSMQFSTKGRDNDKSPSPCANDYKGGWWYNYCHYANPNGLYSGPSTTGLSWYKWKDSYTNFVKSMEMKIRRVE